MKNYQNYEIPQDLIFNTRDIIDMEGLRCSLVLNPADFADILRPPAAIKSAQLKLHFFAMPKEILVQGEIGGKINVQCSRCLKMFVSKFSDDFTQLFPIKDEIIDIMYTTKQTLALLENIQNICAAGCKGLCGVCGCDRNETQCSCRPAAANPFACLKDKFIK
ncbi:MAG: DUF177 domain-containing protein [Elusimicrobiota bacterium]|jgi:uncharacterized protein|nr:DUF177 domain-containing protein [Elusimicrobiota bacterium]